MWKDIQEKQSKEWSIKVAEKKGERVTQGCSKGGTLVCVWPEFAGTTWCCTAQEKSAEQILLLPLYSIQCYCEGTWILRARTEDYCFTCWTRWATVIISWPLTIRRGPLLNYVETPGFRRVHIVVRGLLATDFSCFIILFYEIVLLQWELGNHPVSLRITKTVLGSTPTICKKAKEGLAQKSTRPWVWLKTNFAQVNLLSAGNGCASSKASTLHPKLFFFLFFFIIHWPLSQT